MGQFDDLGRTAEHINNLFNTNTLKEIIVGGLNKANAIHFN